MGRTRGTDPLVDQVEGHQLEVVLPRAVGGQRPVTQGGEHPLRQHPTDAGHQTAAKSIFGYSRNYASLEQIQGTGTDPRSDLYSLAATLYHLLTNVGPEDALTRAMAVLSQKDDPLVPADVVNPAVPRGIAGVLQKAMSLNADERPATANEMRQMFRESENYAYLADPVTIAAPSENTEVLGKGTNVLPILLHFNPPLYRHIPQNGIAALQ